MAITLFDAANAMAVIHLTRGRFWIENRLMTFRCSDVIDADAELCRDKFGRASADYHIQTYFYEADYLDVSLKILVVQKRTTTVISCAVGGLLTLVGAALALRDFVKSYRRLSMILHRKLKFDQF